MTAPLSLEDRILRQLEDNLNAAHRLKAPWRVRAALVAGAGLALHWLEEETTHELL